MILIVHILVALGGLVSTGLLWIKPTQNKLNTSYSLVAVTLATGFYLVFAKPNHITQTCIEGLGYLAVVSFGIILGRNKLVKQITSL